MDVDHHLAAFAEAFVIPARRERWQELLTRRGKNTFANSAKLAAVLDARYCSRDGDWGVDDSHSGVYYDFSGEPEVMTLAQATEKGYFRDAIFSMIPGKFALHFFHEGVPEVS